MKCHVCIVRGGGIHHLLAKNCVGCLNFVLTREMLAWSCLILVYVLSIRNPPPHVAQAVPSQSFKC